MSKQLITGDSSKASERMRREGGFNLLQMMITVTVMIIVGTVAFMGITSARENMRLSGSARQFASYVEKARIDAVRRHTSSAAPSKIEFVDANTYRVTMDFAGSGTASTRTFTFEDGVTLFSEATQPISFDWRGRMTACTLTFALKNTSGSQTTVDISASGDVTVDSDISDTPTISYSNVNQTVDVSSDATVLGTTAPTTTSVTDCSAVDTGPVGGITGTGAISSCKLTINPGAISVKQNGGTTVSLTASVIDAATVTVSAPSNLRITPTSQSIAANGSTTFTVKSLNKTRGTFKVTFSAGCTSVDVMVTVTK
ncbi:MAG TPA: GspH/FimT family pseudopilin [Pyrinomonadaceae bacterium]|jgi:Tfp pilus assembly protein FimT